MSRFHVMAVVETQHDKARLCFLQWLQIDHLGNVTADWHPNPEKRACFPTEATAKAVATLLMECGLCLDADAVEART